MVIHEYPHRDQIAEIFKNMESGNYPAVFERVASDVDWTVMGESGGSGQEMRAH